ncbi:MAG: family 43 glycosylhydrolase [Fuerstiella sp.]
MHCKKGYAGSATHPEIRPGVKVGVTLTIMRSAATALCMIAILGALQAEEPSGDPTKVSIVNGADWVDVEGRPIQAHEGDLARFDGVFYWYGSSYANNPGGKFDIADGPVWNGVQVYRSTDLVNWTYRGVALPRPKNGWGELGATGRSHVIYNEKTKKYVMWYRWYLHVPASFLMVAVADHPEGPFTVLGPREMGTSNGFASDMNIFKDDDGKAYVIYCDHGEHGVQGGSATYTIRIDSLSDDYLDTNQDGVEVFAKGVEAPAMTKYKGKYIAVGSGVHGWAGSETVCAVAESPLGTWTQRKNISENSTWNSQVTDLFYLKESDTVVALCDQWWIPDKSDINKSRYLFLPLHLDPETGNPKMTFRETWSPFSQRDDERGIE